MNRDLERKGISHTWFRGRHLSLSLLGDKHLKLGSKSDHRTEISWNIVQYDALAPRPEGLLLVFCFRMRSFLELKFLQHSWVKNMQLESAKHRKLLLVQVLFFAHEKGGISNRTEFIVSIDKPNLEVPN